SPSAAVWFTERLPHTKLRRPRLRFTVKGLLIVTALIFVVIWAAATYKENRDYREPAESPEERWAIAIARRSLAQRGEPVDQTTYRASIMGDRWMVGVRWITGYDWQGHPEFATGGFSIVEISSDGKVLEIRGGE